MLDRFMNMFNIVANEGHGSVWIVLFIGFIFGAIIQYSRVDKFEKIAGFAILEDMTVPKMLFLSIGLASIGLYFMNKLGWAHYHIKPITLGGLVIGGILFGAAMAIFGKCPGTGPVSVAEGRIDVLVGAIGGIFGGLLFDVAYPWFKHIMGPNLGQLTLPHLFKGHETIIVLIYGTVLVIVAFLLPNKEYLDPKDNEEKAQI